MKDGISVIVPTYNRAELLSRTLKSLAEQTFHSSRYEVIVIDDGSTDQTRQVVDSFRDQINIQYHYQSDQGYRVAKARNIGIQHSTFQYMLFFDSGMYGRENLLQVHYDALSQGKGDVLIGEALGFDAMEANNQGSIASAFDQMDREALFEYLLADAKYHDCRRHFFESVNYDLSRVLHCWVIFWTCHASCKTQDLLAIGGFDEHYQSWGGEDIELALRLAQQHKRLNVIEAPVAIHLPHEKNTAEREQSLLHNLHYTHDKHQLPQTQQLLTGHWWEIVDVCRESIAS
ncbi:glycosyltransferase [Photobacterium sp. TY1-4]|uniref:glycosyltransferase n=1 Tax=Photobacterium sp. TY1-4 TaxID=2899122 RepID=UPI0021BE632A|nr:glycosyltransferase [Photobacterium sp. TY1-4]UXI00904.1 glycosyltransferase [Photobacterium sp. TY1-4]